MSHITCRLTAKNLDQLRDPTLGNQVWATFLYINCRKCYNKGFDSKLTRKLLYCSRCSTGLGPSQLACRLPSSITISLGARSQFTNVVKEQPVRSAVSARGRCYRATDIVQRSPRANKCQERLVKCDGLYAPTPLGHLSVLSGSSAARQSFIAPSLQQEAKRAAKCHMCPYCVNPLLTLLA